MRTYPDNSPQAAARIVTLAMLVRCSEAGSGAALSTSQRRAAEPAFAVGSTPPLENDRAECQAICDGWAASFLGLQTARCEPIG